MRKVVGAYHVATFPRWHEIVKPQGQRLRESGLLARTSKLLVGVVGDPGEDISLLSELLGPNAVVRQLGPLSNFEFPTLQWLYEEVQSRGVACWYAHTKGVSTLGEDKAQWRLRMEAVIFDQYERCLEALNTHDTCGVGWHSGPVGHYPHYPGNFWWANSRYLHKLPPPATLQFGVVNCFAGPPALAVGTGHRGRIEAELWIGKFTAVKAFSI
jgi:hypothetical protein